MTIYKAWRMRGKLGRRQAFSVFPHPFGSFSVKGQQRGRCEREQGKGRQKHIGQGNVGLPWAMISNGSKAEMRGALWHRCARKGNLEDSVRTGVQTLPGIAALGAPTAPAMVGSQTQYGRRQVVRGCSGNGAGRSCTTSRPWRTAREV
jgi:hypothetical protein